MRKANRLADNIPTGQCMQELNSRWTTWQVTGADSSWKRACKCCAVFFKLKITYVHTTFILFSHKSSACFPSIFTALLKSFRRREIYYIGSKHSEMNPHRRYEQVLQILKDVCKPEQKLTALKSRLKQNGLLQRTHNGFRSPSGGQRRPVSLETSHGMPVATIPTERKR
jgi:hypothetical protein